MRSTETKREINLMSGILIELRKWHFLINAMRVWFRIEELLNRSTKEHAIENRDAYQCEPVI